MAGWVCVWVGMRFRNPFGRKKEGRHPLDTRYRKIQRMRKNKGLAKPAIQDTEIHVHKLPKCALGNMRFAW